MYGQFPAHGAFQQFPGYGQVSYCQGLSNGYGMGNVFMGN